jgi:hypothetical protein
MVDEKDEKDEKDEAEESAEDAESKDEPAAAKSQESASASEEEDEDEGDEEEEEKEEDKPAPKAAAKTSPKAASKGPKADDEKETGFGGALGQALLGVSMTDESAARVKRERKPALMLAEFDTTASIMHAAEKVRDAGYTRWDVHTPFPVHGMDRAMGLPDSKLGFIVFTAGFLGVTTAVSMIYFMNGLDYPLVIGGKPPFSIPPSVPIMFELMVLFSAFGAVLGMFHLNKLPQHYHPIFESDRFKAASDDKFYIAVEVADPKYSADKTRALLEKAHATHIEIVEEVVETVVHSGHDDDAEYTESAW